LITTAFVAAGTSSAALGANELQLDVNSLTAQAVGVMAASPNQQRVGYDSSMVGYEAARGSGFGVGYTGSVTMVDDSNSMLAQILCDGNPLAISGSLTDFTGQINFVNGQVDGGSFTVTVLESDGVTTNSYAASIRSGIGFIKTQAGQGFSIDGLTFEGMFSSDTFAGVDVSRWNAAEPLIGSFIQFQFDPNANGVDTDTDIDIFVVVPLPAGGALATIGLVGLAGVRRRRMG
jgi:hypothetical protein